MPGMTHAIAHLRDGHRVHVGRLEDEVVVRARIHQVLLEFVERKIFRLSDSEVDESGDRMDM